MMTTKTELPMQQEFGNPTYTISGAVDRHNWNILRKGQPFIKISKRTNHGRDVYAMLAELNKKPDPRDNFKQLYMNMCEKCDDLMQQLNRKTDIQVRLDSHYDKMSSKLAAIQSIMEIK